MACLCLLLSLIALSSCASPSLQAIPRPNMMEEVAPDQARLFVVRRHQVLGGERTIHVYEGEREIGKLGVGHYLVWDHRPGKRILKFVFERSWIDGGEIEKLARIESTPGGMSYLELGVQAGSEFGGDEAGSPTVTKLDAEAGHLAIQAASPAPLTE